MSMPPSTRGPPGRGGNSTTAASGSTGAHTRASGITDTQPPVPGAGASAAPAPTGATEIPSMTATSAQRAAFPERSVSIPASRMPGPAEPAP